MKNHGFTLIEILVVIAIAAILMAIAHLNFTEMMKRENLKTDLEMLSTEIRTRQIENITRKNVAILFVGDNKITSYSYDSSLFDYGAAMSSSNTNTAPGMPNPVDHGTPLPMPTPIELNLKTPTTGYSTIYIDVKGLPYSDAGVVPIAMCIDTGAIVVHANQIRTGRIQPGDECKPEKVSY